MNVFIFQDGTLSNDDGNQTEDLLRSLNVKNLNRRKKFVNERDRSSSQDKVDLAKPFNLTERKQKREGDQSGQKQK